MQTRLAILVLAAALACPGPLAAQNTSQGAISRAGAGSQPDGPTTGWHVERGGRIRLVARAPDAGGTVLAALHIRLDDGFKTYWRNPGQSGIPPAISFFRSRNVEEPRMVLPPPAVFREPGDVTVGYKDEVVFPVTFRLADPSRSYTLRATGTVGFCAEICVPVPFDVATSGEPAMSLATASLATAAHGAVKGAHERIHVTRAVHHAQENRLDVEAMVHDADVHLELLVDPQEGLALPAAADTVHQSGKRATFSFPLAPGSGVEPGRKLRTTLVIGRFGLNGRIAVEQEVEVEAAD